MSGGDHATGRMSTLRSLPKWFAKLSDPHRNPIAGRLRVAHHEYRVQGLAAEDNLVQAITRATEMSRKIARESDVCQRRRRMVVGMMMANVIDAANSLLPKDQRLKLSIK
ncbi:hypothetical protein [uncultured Nitratireductor sp.]|uniref:hypothetical protein n=1 Tax=uncultured Nitratireductor sp. TaxID=520953 RepID=UPI0025EA1DC8|nr:hypothetical protein [uncultured Nitratireductor sp.]